MDAITLLKDDHKTVERLFKKFEKAGDRAFVEKRRIVDQIIEELSRHAAIEEQLFYPVARATVPGTEDMALESLEEHHVVKWLLDELSNLDVENERFDAKTTVLIENVRHHVEEEEGDFFPKVRDALGRNDLNDLGDAMAKAKESAPTHPHPRSPDTPPANLVTGAAAGVVDRVGDAVSGIAQGGVSAAQDLIARILHNATPSRSPRGSSAARGRAKGVRRAASTAVDGAEATARAATSGASKTVRTAKAGAKGTATTARRSGRRTATTAKRAASSTRSSASSAARKTAGTAKKTARSTKAAAKSRA